MNQKLKEQAHKEFDEMKKGFIAVQQNEWWSSDEDHIKDFIDSLIDKIVQSERERIVGIMLNQEQNFKQLWKEYKGTKTKGEFYSYLVTNKK